MKTRKRNNGWGRSLFWACKEAIKHRYGEGRYSTVKTHIEHGKHFAKWMKATGIDDFMRITTNDLTQYATYVRDRQSNNYARNLISSANVIIESIRQDRKVRINPSAVLPTRTTARQSTPKGLNAAQVEAAAEDLMNRNQHRVAILILLIRYLGLRVKEGCLKDLRKALRRARKYQNIDVRQGTKGGRGRHVERLVPVSQREIDILVYAQQFCSPETHNLIPEGMLSIQFMRIVHNEWRKIRKKYDLNTIRDLRSAYACDRYHQITGHQPPACLGGHLAATKEADRAARDVIVKEVGHGKRSRMAPYVGRGAR